MLERVFFLFALLHCVCVCACVFNPLIDLLRSRLGCPTLFLFGILPLHLFFIFILQRPVPLADAPGNSVAVYMGFRFCKEGQSVGPCSAFGGPPSSAA